MLGPAAYNNFPICYSHLHRLELRRQAQEKMEIGAKQPAAKDGAKQPATKEFTRRNRSTNTRLNYHYIGIH